MGSRTSWALGLGALTVLELSACRARAESQHDETPKNGAAPVRTQHDETPRAQPAASTTRQALAAVGSVVPGVLIHGSGSWIAGQHDVAWDLFALQGVGLGLFLTGGTTIVLSGAARSLIGPAIATTTVGAGLFAASWLLDVYHTAVPEHARGQARGARDGTRSYAELGFVDSRQFRYGPLLRHGALVSRGRFVGGYEGQHAPLGRFDHWRLAAGYRPWQADAQRSGNFLQLQAAALTSQHLDEDFVSRGFEASARMRLDSHSLAAGITGAFTEFEVGLGWQRTHWLPDAYAPAASMAETLLIARSAVGVYLGDPWQHGGELQVYYDHRHDGLAEGMLAKGLGSGAIGHVGLATEYFLDRNFGLRASSEVGSAWVVTLGLNVRSER